jgi:hypothetical protein
MAEAMDRPDISKLIKEYRPEPDPMQQAMAETELEQGKANAAKDNALAKNAEARTVHEMTKARKEAASIDPDIIKKYADVNKTVAETAQGNVKTQADAYNKVKTADKPTGGNSGQ